MAKFLKVKELENPTTGRILEYVDKKPAVLGLVVNSDETKGLFVKQYRAGSQSEIWECPAGVIDEEINEVNEMHVAISALNRELREEVGLSAKDIETISFVKKIYSSVGWTNEICYLFIVKVKENFTLLEQELDEEECLTYEWIDLDKIANMYGDLPIPIKTAYCLNEFEKRQLENQLKPKKRICIFGGSFNPVTNLHMSMAERVIDELGIDLFFFEPVGDKYEKESLIDSSYRVDMLARAIINSENPKLQLGVFETNQFVQPTTMATLTHYHNLYPEAEIFFMVGSDNLSKISSWANNEKLLEDFQMVCIQREGDDNIYQDIILNDYYLSTYHKRIHILYENATNNISSTKVRNLVKANKSITYLVPPLVKQYIQKNGLYK